MKTHRGAAKRFGSTSNNYKRKGAYLRHILTKKSAKRKAGLSGMRMVSKSDSPLVKRMLADG